MNINFLVTNHTRGRTSHKTVKTWQEMEELHKRGFETFNQKDFQTIRAMGFNEPLCQEIVNIRKKMRLPKEGIDGKEAIEILNGNTLLTLKARFESITKNTYNKQIVAWEVYTQLFNLSVLNHAMVPINQPVLYFSNKGLLKFESEKKHLYIAIPGKMTMNALHRYIDDAAGILKIYMEKIYGEGPTISDRDLRIYEIKKAYPKKTFDEIADQIGAEFNLNKEDVEISYDTVRIAYSRTKKSIEGLFLPSNRT